MAEPVKTRRYDASRRRARAEQTRRAVLVSARDRFASRGYADTAVADVAAGAGVSVDTVYASVGRKAELLLAVIDMSLAGGDEPVPAEDRDYVRAIHEAPTAQAKIAVYAAALGTVLPRTAPLLAALEDAAVTDEACARVRHHVDVRRHNHMLRFAADLRATGQLRPDLDDRTVADVVWASSAFTAWRLLERQGWTPVRFSTMLRETWTRTLLA